MLSWCRQSLRFMILCASILIGKEGENVVAKNVKLPWQRVPSQVEGLVFRARYSFIQLEEEEKKRLFIVVMVSVFIPCGCDCLLKKNDMFFNRKKCTSYFGSMIQTILSLAPFVDGPWPSSG